jgi:hypothetical protein
MRISAWALLMPVLIGAACSGPSSPTADPLAGGVVATFRVGNDSFRVWIRNSRTIAEVLALQRGASLENIPNGRLRIGAGQGSHNVPYSWHLDPDDIEMAGAAIEVCDGAPSYIEAHRDEFISQVGRYCPWGATLVSVADHR